VNTVSQCAANQVHLVSVPPIGAITESWNPICLDLGGTLAAAALGTSAAQFNVDGTANLNARLAAPQARPPIPQTNPMAQCPSKACMHPLQAEVGFDLLKQTHPLLKPSSIHENATSPQLPASRLGGCFADARIFQS